MTVATRGVGVDVDHVLALEEPTGIGGDQPVEGLEHAFVEVIVIWHNLQVS